jgi:hypothetical protein
MVRYWDNAGIRSELLAVLGSQNRYNDATTRNAWEDVARHVFLQREMINDQDVRWVVQRELFQGPEGRPNPFQPDASVVRLVKVASSSRIGSRQNLSFNRYNWLVIETEPPSQDKPNIWVWLLHRACSRLMQYHDGSHQIFLICAVGLSYMLFTWEPQNACVPGTELQLQADDTMVRFPSQLRPSPTYSPHVPNLGVVGHPHRYLIVPSLVWSIEPWQIDTQGQARTPLLAIEIFMRQARNARIQNPYRVTC